MLAISQEKQLLLSQQYQQKKLPHAIILQGREGAGTEVLASWFLSLLICQQPQTASLSESEDNILQACDTCKSCQLRQSNTHPDHLLLLAENKTLGVDDIRKGNAFLEKTAHLGRLKTVLIPQAQLMTAAAANALLKTLEEPNPNSFIVLITDEIDNLLPTIVSRCAHHSIRPKVGSALIQQLNATSTVKPRSSDQLDPIDSNPFVNLSQLPELTDEQTFQQSKKFTEIVIDFICTGNYEGEVIDELVNNKHGFRWLEKTVCDLLRTFYIDKTCNKQISEQVLYQLYQTIIKSNKLIKSYSQTNQQFVAEQLVIKMNDIVGRNK